MPSSTQMMRMDGRKGFQGSFRAPKKSWVAPVPKMRNLPSPGENAHSACSPQGPVRWFLSLSPWGCVSVFPAVNSLETRLVSFIIVLFFFLGFCFRFCSHAMWRELKRRKPSPGGESSLGKHVWTRPRRLPPIFPDVEVLGNLKYVKIGV